MRPFGRRIRLKCITSGQGNQLALEGWSTTDRTLETSWPSHTDQPQQVYCTSKVVPNKIPNKTYE